MSAAVSFEEYTASLQPLSEHVDPTVESDSSQEILRATDDLAALETIDRDMLTLWVTMHPDLAYVLTLSLGMSQERMRNTIRVLFDTASIRRVAMTQPRELIARLDEDYGLVRMLTAQLGRTYTFGDVLVARAGSRVRAQSAGTQGRGLEDEIEAVAARLGLPYELRTRFTGRGGRDAPCDLAIPGGDETLIAVAAKGFDSTGSKLTDAVREIQEMAEVRLPRQFICAVVDGFGWRSRQADLRRIYELWDTDQIDGLYTLSSLPRFGEDILQAARLRGLRGGRAD